MGLGSEEKKNKIRAQGGRSVPGLRRLKTHYSLLIITQNLLLFFFLLSLLLGTAYKYIKARTSDFLRLQNKNKKPKEVLKLFSESIKS